MAEVAASKSISLDETPNQEESLTPSDQADDQTPDGDDRPDWLPEKFWAEGAPKYEDLAKSYNELETWRLKSKEESMEMFKDEIIEAQRGSPVEGVPESMEMYEFKYDTGILPEGIHYTAPNEDPMLDWWRQHCFDNRMPQQVFETGINAFLKADIETMPNVDEEIARLGENGNDRFRKVMIWLRGNTSEKTQSVINNQRMSADLIEALEEIQSKSSSGVPGSVNLGAQEPSVTEGELRKMQSEPGYITGTDKDLMRKVQAGYAALSAKSKRK
tara:strand:- start:1507 stop:2325 length:819 start_codon:yes stop_codon:yes gene_type:complete